MRFATRFYRSKKRRNLILTKFCCQKRRESRSKADPLEGVGRREGVERRVGWACLVLLHSVPKTYSHAGTSRGSAF